MLNTKGDRYDEPFGRSLPTTGMPYRNFNHEPDLEDAATLRLILEIIREKLECIHVGLIWEPFIDGGCFMVWSPDCFTCSIPSNGCLGSGNTEADALFEAMEEILKCQKK